MYAILVPILKEKGVVNIIGSYCGPTHNRVMMKRAQHKYEGLDLWRDWNYFLPYLKFIRHEIPIRIPGEEIEVDDSEDYTHEAVFGMADDFGHADWVKYQNYFDDGTIRFSNWDWEHLFKRIWCANPDRKRLYEHAQARWLKEQIQLFKTARETVITRIEFERYHQMAMEAAKDLDRKLAVNGYTTRVVYH